MAVTTTMSLLSTMKAKYLIKRYQEREKNLRKLIKFVAVIIVPSDFLTPQTTQIVKYNLKTTILSFILFYLFITNKITFTV